MIDELNAALQPLMLRSLPPKLFFLGLAKNTGKTTTLNCVADKIKNSTSHPLVFMSSGYDGEDLDAISGMPKPKIKLPKASYFISTDTVLHKVEGECQLIHQFPIFTPFGQIILGKSEQFLQLALVSPGSVEKMRYVLSWVNHYLDHPFILIDGSINRKAFLKLGTPNDAVILATGLAYSNSLEEHTNAVSMIYQWLTLPMVPEQWSGIKTPLVDASIIEYALTSQQTIVIPDITSIYVNNEILENYIKLGGQLFTQRLPPALSFISVNPYNPYNQQAVTTDWFSALRISFPNIPIINVLDSYVTN